MTRRELLHRMGLLAVCGLGLQEGATGQANSKAYSFVNGRWFDGVGFRPQTFYSASGLFTRRKPGAVDTVMDLGGGYVVPPFGDAHCHHFDGPYNVEQQVRMYLRDGIFYAKVLTNSLSGARAVAGRVNRPDSVDVVYAQGGLTGTDSHPIPVYEALGLGYYTFHDQQAHRAEILKSHRRENDCYYIIDTRADLDRKWPLILAGQPDFIKVFLLHSEDYEKRRREKGYGGGIDPKLLPEIVARAHRAGRTVSAHVESAGDYHTALTAGVDEMAHLPGYSIEASEDVRTYQLSPEDVTETGRRGVRVVPTASLAASIAVPRDRERTRANQIRNLTLLKAAGVRFGIGTDNYGLDSLKEALYLSDLGVFTPLEMLKMWCEDTPRAAFPHRKIGRLEEGYEASFLVLKADPLEKFGHVKDISLRFKQGGFINVTGGKGAAAMTLRILAATAALLTATVAVAAPAPPGLKTTVAAKRYQFVLCRKDQSSFLGDWEWWRYGGHQVQTLARAPHSDFLLVRRTEGLSIITDDAVVRAALGVLAPLEALGRRQGELGRQQEALGSSRENSAPSRRKPLLLRSTPRSAVGRKNWADGRRDWVSGRRRWGGSRWQLW